MAISNPFAAFKPSSSAIAATSPSSPVAAPAPVFSTPVTLQDVLAMTDPVQQMQALSLLSPTDRAQARIAISKAAIKAANLQSAGMSSVPTLQDYLAMTDPSQKTQAFTYLSPADRAQAQIFDLAGLTAVPTLQDVAAMTDPFKREQAARLLSPSDQAQLSASGIIPSAVTTPAATSATQPAYDGGATLVEQALAQLNAPPSPEVLQARQQQDALVAQYTDMAKAALPPEAQSMAYSFALNAAMNPGAAPPTAKDFQKAYNDWLVNTQQVDPLDALISQRFGVRPADPNRIFYDVGTNAYLSDIGVPTPTTLEKALGAFIEGDHTASANFIRQLNSQLGPNALSEKQLIASVGQSANDWFQKQPQNPNYLPYKMGVGANIEGIAAQALQTGFVDAGKPDVAATIGQQLAPLVEQGAAAAQQRQQQYDASFKNSYGGIGSLLGGILGIALAPATGGASLALAGGLGAAAGQAAGSYLSGDPFSLRNTLQAGLLGATAGYGLGALGAGAGAGAAGAGAAEVGAAGAAGAADVGGISSLVAGSTPTVTAPTALSTVANLVGAPAEVVSALNNPFVSNGVMSLVKSGVTGQPLEKTIENLFTSAVGSVVGGGVSGLTADAGSAISNLSGAVANYATQSALKGQDVNLQDFATNYALNQAGAAIKGSIGAGFTDSVAPTPAPAPAPAPAPDTTSADWTSGFDVPSQDIAPAPEPVLPPAYDIPPFEDIPPYIPPSDAVAPEVIAPTPAPEVVAPIPELAPPAQEGIASLITPAPVTPPEPLMPPAPEPVLPPAYDIPPFEDIPPYIPPSDAVAPEVIAPTPTPAPEVVAPEVIAPTPTPAPEVAPIQDITPSLPADLAPIDLTSIFNAPAQDVPPPITPDVTPSVTPDWTSGFDVPTQDTAATTGAPMDPLATDVAGYFPSLVQDMGIDPNAIGTLPSPDMVYGPDPLAGIPNFDTGPALSDPLAGIPNFDTGPALVDALPGLPNFDTGPALAGTGTTPPASSNAITDFLKNIGVLNPQGSLTGLGMLGGAAGLTGLLSWLGSQAKPSGGGPQLPQYAGIDMRKYAPATTAAPTVYQPTYEDYRNPVTAADGGLMALGHGTGNVTVGADPRRNPSPLSQDNQNNMNWQDRSEPLMRMAAGGGISSLGSYSDGGRLLKGPGDGMSDHIPATIGDKQPARLADGEFVIPADVVSHLGNGSTDAGANVLYGMMDRIRKARTGNPKQGKQINPNKFTPA